MEEDGGREPRDMGREHEQNTDLELRGLHGDGDADEEDAEHGDGGVALPVLGPAIGPARHAPHLVPKVLHPAMVHPVPSAAVSSCHGDESLMRRPFRSFPRPNLFLSFVVWAIGLDDSGFGIKARDDHVI
ncbi:hypothetical protein B296_00019492 [Ensete ventricosum]|uniref:Uncharacterized protein n=1 Tax=Ensete ventricosum TaxID=4639 RepID=A0A427B2I4_ENSVE|nr:hypothetical protein B296_00019492 [Ensete ventricosum]